jgi:hypothetical protein
MRTAVSSRAFRFLRCRTVVHAQELAGGLRALIGVVLVEVRRIHVFGGAAISSGGEGADARGFEAHVAPHRAHDREGETADHRTGEGPLCDGLTPHHHGDACGHDADRRELVSFGENSP